MELHSLESKARQPVDELWESLSQHFTQHDVHPENLEAVTPEMLTWPFEVTILKSLFAWTACIHSFIHSLISQSLSITKQLVSIYHVATPC